MPYISTELVKKIREEIKKEFPELKCSIIREHYSSIYVKILSTKNKAFQEFDGQYKQVNHFYIADHYKGNIDLVKILLKINDIMNQKNGVEVVDSDYGAIPDYYTNIHIGQWDKPFQFINN